MHLATILRSGALALRRMRVPIFLSKYSKKDFTVHQHILLCAVRELEKKMWRDLRERIEDSKAVDLVDVPTGLIVATRSLSGTGHEAPHLVPMLQTLNMSVKEVYGDKSFDSESTHRFLWERGAAGYIDVKGEPRYTYSFRRRFWAFKQEHPRIWRRKYGRRPFIESTCHAEKAVMGEV